ncbi:hypothetical protein KC324_g18746, partial [Hortaea werneckii]
MTPVRVIPSIDEQIAKAQARSRKDSIIMPERSEANAKEATQAFSKEKLAPFMSHQNPESKPGVTFAAQDKLPKLPIPDLKQTCERYLAALDPLQTAREHADSERAVAEFMRSDGPQLQEKLKEYASGRSSYIEQFWYDSYLNF